MTKARDLANVISGSGTLNANVIPALPASKITSGTFADARLSSSSVTQHVDLTALSASNLTSGTVPSARLSLSASDVPDLATSKITSGTFADARLSASSVTQHVDLSNLNASNLTSGSIPNARVPSSAVTQHVSAVTNQSGSWTPSPSNGGFSGVSGRYHKTGNICICFAHGKFSSRTAENNNQFFINGLPFTARNSGDVQGSGFCDFNSNQSMNLLPIIKANESRIRLYSSAADMFTTATKSTEGLSSVDRNMMITNKNMRQSSEGNTNDNFTIRIYFITA